jgi:hypothetical protein
MALQLLSVSQFEIKSLAGTCIDFCSQYDRHEFAGTLSLGLIPTLKDPTKQSSTGEPLILPMLLIPLLCGSGASLLVPFFGLFQPRFSFGHPGFLSENLSVDFWGPWMISLCYGTIVDGRGLLFGGCRQLLQYGTLYGFDPALRKASSPTPWMRPDEAHVLCSLILSITYILNDLGPQFLNRFTIPEPGNSTKKKEVQQQSQFFRSVSARVPPQDQISPCYSYIYLVKANHAASTSCFYRRRESSRESCNRLPKFFRESL